MRAVAYRSAPSVADDHLPLSSRRREKSHGRICGLEYLWCPPAQIYRSAAVSKHDLLVSVFEENCIDAWDQRIGIAVCDVLVGSLNPRSSRFSKRSISGVDAQGASPCRRHPKRSPTILMRGRRRVPSPNRSDATRRRSRRSISEASGRLYPTAIAALDDSFFRVCFDRLTPSEKRYLRGMADVGCESAPKLGPCWIAPKPLSCLGNRR